MTTTQARTDLGPPRRDAWTAPQQDGGGAPSSLPHEPLGPVYAGITVGALAVAGATAVGLRWASRPAAPKTITMGPGGWVSFKGLPPPHVGARRPWWAVLLRAQRRT